MDKATIITLIVAIWGAALSTYQWIESRIEKRRVARVTLRQGLIASMGRTSEWMMFIGIANPGSKTITVNQPLIQLPDKRSLLFHVAGSDVQFPHDLMEGKSCKIWVEMAEVAKALRDSGYGGKTRIRGIVSDAVGTEFIGKRLAVNVDKWLPK